MTEKTKYWICSKCGLLNKIKKYKCRNCESLILLNTGLVQFETIDKMKKWIKLVREKMGGKVWWAP